MPPKARLRQLQAARAIWNQQRRQAASSVSLPETPSPPSANAALPPASLNSGNDGISSPEYIPLPLEEDDEDCCFSGNVNDLVERDIDWVSSDDSDSDDSDEDLEDIDAESLEKSKKPLDEEELSEIHFSPKPTVHDVLDSSKSAKDWKVAERGIHGYTGHSDRTKSRRNKAARDGEETWKKVEASTDPQVSMMRAFFAPHPDPEAVVPEILALPQSFNKLDNPSPASIVDYDSDHSEPPESDVKDGLDGLSDTNDNDITGEPPRASASSAPPLKRRRHAIPVRRQRELQKESRQKQLADALTDIKALILSRKTCFQERAAESQGFRPVWGGRMLRTWTCVWVEKRELPQSQRGSHGKVFSLLDDPQIKAELRAYVHSHKWAMNPAKVKDLAAGKLIPAAAAQYTKELVNKEMPAGLKKYMEYAGTLSKDSNEMYQRNFPQYCTMLALQ
ncbi:hypothetical protein C8J56DRAFT_880029 [Mycena floridula]|nr:hypothetical protein C8J56DRAFT_880029 [Mycena floridula]